MGLRKKKGGHGGGHGWFVTFADLMGLLMSFFVVVAAFSTMDKDKFKSLLGSMQNAMGVSPDSRQAGIIEIAGVPNRPYLRDVGQSRQDSESGGLGPTSRNDADHGGTSSQSEMERQFANAAATLRQALSDLPELAALSRQINTEITAEGLAINIVDQDGRSMFAEGSRFPLERARRAFEALGPILARLPNDVRIVGHTNSKRAGLRPDYDLFELSSDRAHSVRRILSEHGLAAGRVREVLGRGAQDPLFPNDPTLPANARVTVLLLPSAPPAPPRFR